MSGAGQGGGLEGARKEGTERLQPAFNPHVQEYRAFFWKEVGLFSKARKAQRRLD